MVKSLRWIRTAYQGFNYFSTSLFTDASLLFRMSCKIGVPISAAKMGTIMIIAEGSILVVPHSVSFFCGCDLTIKGCRFLGTRVWQ
jgi:hypothetical protein